MSGAPALGEVAAVLAEAAGISLGEGLGGALRGGLAAAAAALGVREEELARRVVARDGEAVVALVEHTVVGETSFWRHAEQIAAVAAVAREREGPLSIWSAGCATGEEPFSLAIALLEAGRRGRGDRIAATDVSARALAAAAAGAYHPRALRNLPRPLEERWFEPGEPRRVRAELREVVTFARHNLVADPAPAGAPFDVVLCRNVLIYFTPETAAAVLYRLVGALAPGGILVLGPVELPLASPLGLAWVERDGATLLVRPR